MTLYLQCLTPECVLLHATTVQALVSYVCHCNCWMKPGFKPLPCHQRLQHICQRYVHGTISCISSREKAGIFSPQNANQLYVVSEMNHIPLNLTHYIYQLEIKEQMTADLFLCIQLL